MMDIHEDEDLAMLSEEPSQSNTELTLSSSTVPSGSSIQADESQGQPLASEEGEGGKPGRRRSVTFAEVPLVEGSGRSGQPKSPGLRKGFFGKPKPVLKRTSSISDDSSSTVDRLLPEDRDSSESSRTRQAQSSIDDARDEAFSGHVVERSVSHVTEPALMYNVSPGPWPASQVSRESQTEVSPHHPHLKVSRFKQQRNRPV